MKKKLAIALSSLLLLTACSSSGTTDLSAQEFQAKTLESGVVTLDVRTPGEFFNGHIAGAMNIDVEGMNFNSEIEKLDKSATYAVYCRSGRRSEIAVQAMKDAGFKDLFNMKAGTEEWSAAGLPLVAE